MDPNNSDIIIFSWLVSGNATKNVGSLNFSLRFAYVNDNGIVEYDWHTSIYKNLSVGQSINNAGEIVYKHADILAQLESSIMAFKEEIQDVINERLGVIENGTY